ncbi:hypothetical protein PUNSTDRAFT_134660 [Punctularia strigosozonata HHB-11173 SS5]|uniref:uncharacterized protein n=1 Tax=Punctularia strigosozonata (strain HHB-11173) TaxID=741275 RepID=UPI00044164ED|nr:uncharacterized protein PUNSTDRAFT_134660 [Punctularia strigosozonata HHB-11173 SS5]EIN08268.1 hypothetical protein PUNSTDRAFT_134660 [Punctularia strigosozonata HHB-11173 SS5]
MSQPVAMQSPLTVVFLLHIALEIPVAIQGIWSPQSLPFLELNNTTLVVLKLYSALLLGTCVASLLCFSLPEFLPGKRAFAIALCMYHSICSTILFQSPRFIPKSMGALAETWKFTPEVLWGTLHGLLGLFFMAWWQGTVGSVTAAKRLQQ